MSSTGLRYDCVVVGGGHNGLICAAYLARSGRSVLVVEAAEQVGGAAVTREFATGYRVSACAHLMHSLSAQVVRDLDLGKHGLRWASGGTATTALSPDGDCIVLRGDAVTSKAGNTVPGEDSSAYAQYISRLGRFARALGPVLESVPPRLGTDAWADRAALLRLGWRIRRLGRRDMRELLRIGAMNVYDLLQETFSSPLLQGALGLDAVLGTNLGPRSPGSVFTLLYRLAAAASAASAGSDSGSMQPLGGMGSLSGALAKAAVAAGAHIRTGAPVTRILVERDQAAGVELASGESIAAQLVVSNADPKTTFLHL